MRYPLNRSTEVEASGGKDDAHVTSVSGSGSFDRTYMLR